MPYRGRRPLQVQQLAPNRTDGQRVHAVDRDLTGPAPRRHDDLRRPERPPGRVHDHVGSGGLNALHPRACDVRAASLAGTPERGSDRRRACVPVRRREQGSDAAGRDFALELPDIRALQVAAPHAARRARACYRLQLGRLRVIERNFQRTGARIHLLRHVTVEQPIRERIPQPETSQTQRFEHGIVQALRVRREHPR